MSKSPKNKSVRSFLKEVGRDSFQSELGKSPQVVTRAIKDNLMPAHWYIEVRDWAEAKGVSAPEYLFRFDRKPADSKQNGNCGDSAQVV